jgi:hypothetical protein
MLGFTITDFVVARMPYCVTHMTSTPHALAELIGNPQNRFQVVNYRPTSWK